MGLNAYLAEVLADSPTSLYALQETGGTTAADDGSGNHDGTYTNGVTLGVQGPAENVLAADFERSDSEYVAIADHDDFTPAGSFTIEAWFNKESAGTVQKLFAKDAGGSNREYALHFSAADEISLTIYRTDGSTYLEAVAATEPALATWYYAAAVFDSTVPEALIYLDAVEEGSDSTPSGTREGNTTAAVAIGRRTSQDHFDGKACLVGWYNGVALAPARILAHHAAMFTVEIDPVDLTPVAQALAVGAFVVLSPANVVVGVHELAVDSGPITVELDPADLAVTPAELVVSFALDIAITPVDLTLEPGLLSAGQPTIPVSDPPDTTLDTGIDADDGTIIADDASEWPRRPFVFRFATGERVRILSRVGNILTVAPNGRGWRGSGATAHLAGEGMTASPSGASLSITGTAGGIHLDPWERARPILSRWRVNLPAETEILAVKRDPDTAAQLRALREVRCYFNDDLLFGGPILDPEASVRVGGVTVPCADPSWYFSRGFIGKARDNFLENGNFEDDLDHWTEVGITADIVTDKKYVGTQSVEVTNATARGETYLRQIFTTPPNGLGLLVIITARYRLESVTAHALQRRGLFVAGYEGGVLKSTNFDPIDRATRRKWGNGWYLARTTIQTPPFTPWDIEVRPYFPQGVAGLDHVRAVCMESLSTADNAEADVNAEDDLKEIGGSIVLFSQAGWAGKSNKHIGVDLTPLSGVTMSKHYQFADWLSIPRALEEFTQRGDGFDHEVRQTTPTTRVFRMHHPRKGVDWTGEFVLRVGPGELLADATYGQAGSDTITQAHVLGEGDGPERDEGHATDTDGVPNDLILESVTNAPAGTSAGALRPMALELVEQTSPVPELITLISRPNDPVLIHDVWHGDLVPVDLNDGWIQYDGLARIEEKRFRWRDTVVELDVVPEPA